MIELRRRLQPERFGLFHSTRRRPSNIRRRDFTPEETTPDDLATAIRDVQTEADGLLTALRRAHTLAIESKVQGGEYFTGRSIEEINRVKVWVGHIQASIATKQPTPTIGV